MLLFLYQYKFFFKLIKIFLWITLRIYFATAKTFIFLIKKKKRKNQEISLNQRNYSMTAYQCTNFFDSKKFCLNQRNFFLGVVKNHDIHF